MPGFDLRGRQLDALALLGGPQRHTMLVGGARSSKTTLVVRAIIMRSLMAPGSRHAILRFRQNAVKRSIALDTFPKTVGMCFPGVVFEEHKQEQYYVGPNKSEIWMAGLDDKDRADQILGLEFCVDPAALVLTADLRWVPAIKIQPLDEIIAFPEDLTGHMRLERSVVTASKIIEADRLRVVTTRGSTIVSADHKFVAYADDRRHKNFRSLSWAKAKSLKPGDFIRFAAPTWKTANTYEDGWLAEILDGEGWVSQTCCGVGQNEGWVLDKIERSLIEREIRVRRHQSQRCVQLVATAMWDAMRLLGTVRPVRLMMKADRVWEGRKGFVARAGASNRAPGKNTDETGRHVAKIIRIEAFGVGPVVALTTTTGTLIADGFLGHNCSMFFNECSQIPYSSYLTARTRLAQVCPIDFVPGSDPRSRAEHKYAQGKALPQRFYYDLNPTGTGHWTYKLFVQHQDPDSGRPQVNPDEYKHMFLSPYDNKHNLTPEFIEELEALPERQRKRFLEGVYVAEIEGALWSVETIEQGRMEPTDALPPMQRIVVAIDPSGTAGEEDERSDEVGIIVAGRGFDGLGYVLADRTCKMGPAGWGAEAMKAYVDFRADAVVAEQNFGGDMVRYVVQMAAKAAGVPGVKIRKITASRGKAVRAEPIAALYEQRKIRHVGRFDRLEDQMLNMSTAGYQGHRSPDRLDALVWALSELMLKQTPDWLAVTRQATRSNGAIPIYGR